VLTLIVTYPENVGKCSVMGIVFKKIPQRWEPRTEKVLKSGNQKQKVGADSSPYFKKKQEKKISSFREGNFANSLF